MVHTGVVKRRVLYGEEFHIGISLAMTIKYKRTWHKIWEVIKEELSDEFLGGPNIFLQNFNQKNRATN